MRMSKMPNSRDKSSAKQKTKAESKRRTEDELNTDTDTKTNRKAETKKQQCQIEPLVEIFIHSAVQLGGAVQCAYKSRG